MRIGIDGRKIPEAADLGPLGVLERAKELGMEGVFFRTVLDISPDLDSGLLVAVRDRADELGLYLEAGLGKVNPFATPETPELRRTGDGDIVLGFRRMMEACARIGVTELWVSTTGAKPYRGRFGTDRFRTDVTWEAQLEATRRFLGVLAPIAREVGVHMNMETHEEITTFEIVRLIEATGADVMGVVLDTANPLLRGEHPLRAAERVAPFVRQTHFKDAYVELVEGGAYQESRPCGDGVIDFGAVLDVLLSHNPDVNLTFENDQPRSEAERLYGRGAGQGEPHLVELDHPDWAPAHPDLTLDERQEYLDLARAYTARVRAGEVQSWQQRRAAPFEVAESIDWIRRAEEHITRLLAEKGIARAAAAVR